MKNLFIIILLLVAQSNLFGQQLILKSGNIYDENNKKLTNNQVRTALENNQDLLNSFNASKSKITIGGFLLGFGLGAMAGDLVGALTSDVQYPSAFTIVGAASTLISIPVLIGRNKKLKNAVDGYNESLNGKKTSFNIEKINIISNNNGVGMVIGF